MSTDVTTTRADLVTAALLGLRRGGPDVDAAALPGVVGEAVAAAPAAEGAARLLDVVALDVVARRAGVVPASPDATPPVPAEPEPASVAGPAARARLTTLLAGSGELNDVLVAHWLRTAAARGCVAPPRLLPELLEWTARPASRPHLALVQAVLGTRGHWLAAQRHSWAGLLDAVPRDAAGTARAADDARAVVDDPQWSKRPAAERVTAIEAIGRDVRRDDEERLARSLADRAATVREAAAQVLVHLPGAAFAQDCARRALECVAIERRMLRHVLVVRLPQDDPTAPFERVRSVTGGRRGHLLRALVAATPPDVWVAHLGKDAGTLVRLDVTDDLGPLLHDAWQEAALRTRDAAWAAALLGEHPEWTHLLAVLPGPERAAAAGAIAARSTTSDLTNARRAIQAGRALDAPWPDAFTDDVLRHVVAPPVMPEWELRHELPTLAAGAATDPGTEQRVRAAADRCTDDGTARVLRTLADTLRTRREILEELA
ncbi:conserved hypothetical protein [Cellulomonas flavigena DSM 20109]|uniref:Uncharacterized protein n=1 Tax=Cellulomonas flavigena (strain ATCC 482 / DSM 20109 / BCRC 11376 / JCM 18109 / NBRC 3775 / NCIMB 8073 / NRS 134) TaxID=446466 RepID=D5UBT1_CELFN|nr:DUF5691 domain-containing protein [Cellulomonas flavigena]ADG74176.1 conserved hypothetical protein [Cellulomonas flavigena DSM 20109]